MTITFNRPDKLNAMNHALMSALIVALRRAGADPVVRVIVLTGSGRAFMAGADLKDYAAQSEMEFVEFQALGRELYAAIEGNAKPVIAAINGHCFGGGFEIALACDLLCAIEGAKCGLPEINLALIPGGGGTQRLALRAGLSFALEAVLTGRTILAEELKSLGVVNRVFGAAEFAARVAEFAGEIAAKEPSPVQCLKRLARQALAPTHPATGAAEIEALRTFFLSEAGRARIRDFLTRGEARRRPGGAGA